MSSRGRPRPGTRAPGAASRCASSPSVASGAVVRAGVSERFALLDQSQVVPLPFTEDIVLYARPRLGAAGTLGATFAITPSLDFTIQQLALGTVKLDVPSRRTPARARSSAPRAPRLAIRRDAARRAGWRAGGRHVRRPRADRRPDAALAASRRPHLARRRVGGPRGHHLGPRGRLSIPRPPGLASDAMRSWYWRRCSSIRSAAAACALSAAARSAPRA